MESAKSILHCDNFNSNYDYEKHEIKIDKKIKNLMVLLDYLKNNGYSYKGKHINILLELIDDLLRYKKEKFKVFTHIKIFDIVKLLMSDENSKIDHNEINLCSIDFTTLKYFVKEIKVKINSNVVNNNINNNECVKYLLENNCDVNEQTLIISLDYYDTFLLIYDAYVKQGFELPKDICKEACRRGCYYPLKFLHEVAKIHSDDLCGYYLDKCICIHKKNTYRGHQYNHHIKYNDMMAFEKKDEQYKEKIIKECVEEGFLPHFI